MNIRFIAMLLEIGLFVWAITFTVLYLTQRRRMRGLDAPVLWLPRAERRERARQLLRREDDEYMQQMTEHLTNYIDGRTQKPHEK